MGLVGIQSEIGQAFGQTGLGCLGFSWDLLGFSQVSVGQDLIGIWSLNLIIYGTGY